MWEVLTNDFCTTSVCFRKNLTVYPLHKREERGVPRERLAVNTVTLSPSSGCRGVQVKALGGEGGRGHCSPGGGSWGHGSPPLSTPTAVQLN